MPTPLITGGLITLLGIKGVADLRQAAVDSREAEKITALADDMIDASHRVINEVRNRTKYAIEELGRQKLEASVTELKDFVEIYRRLKNVNVSKSNIEESLGKLPIVSEGSLAEMDDISLEATDVLESGLAGVGAGALLGWGTYGGVMALGSASTGTAIAGLSGVAATNATLAWLGGGAVAAGGGGVALGTAILGGIVAAPALLVAGGIFKSKAREKVNNACAYFAQAEQAVSEVKLGIEKLNHIAATANQINDLLRAIREYTDMFNAGMNIITMSKTDWRQFSQEEKNVVAGAVKMVQILKVILDCPLLTEKGEITTDALGLSGYGKALQYK